MTSDGTYRELSDEAFTRERKKLLRVKGSVEQRHFLALAKKPEEFIDFWSDVAVVGEERVADLERLSENEYRDPPPDTEASVYQTWTDLPPAVACRTSFWASVTLDHIRNDVLHSSWLAANGTGNGAARIDEVLGNNEGDSAANAIDRTVRTVLRRMGGLPEVRGNRSVYVDCPFSRAWWRERFVRRAAAHYGIPNVDAVRCLLRTNQTYFEKFIDRIVFRNSTFGDERVRSRFLSCLAEARASNSDLENPQKLKPIFRQAAAQQGRLELSLLSDDDLDSALRQVL